MRRLLLFAAMLGLLAIAVQAASASQTFGAPIYRSATYTCADGATDTSGARHGTFAATETHGDQLVSASVWATGLYPLRPYNVSVTESGWSCPTSLNVASFTTDEKGNGGVHFLFWAHTHETTAWVTIRHGQTNDIVRSTALPINR